MTERPWQWDLTDKELIDELSRPPASRVPTSNDIFIIKVVLSRILNHITSGVLDAVDVETTQKENYELHGTVS